MQKKLILASSSPRRQELLRQVSIPFTVQKSSIDESMITIIDPAKKVQELAALKANHMELHKNEVILAADTVVAFNKEIFEKPQTKEAARDMMSKLSGNVHDVFTGVMIRSGEREISFVERTEVEFWPLSKAEIDWYISTEDPYDKAGGYGVQSLGAMFVKKIIGDYYNVVGLPLSRVVRELRDFEIFPEKN